MADIMETDPSSGFQSSDDEAEEVPIESLVSGRAKRSTAGTHMSALIEAAADDDLSLLFEEVEDDNEFAGEAEGAEDDDDAMESSSDDDDQGPNATNDYEGEQELQKAERKKRRAQNDLRFQTLRKRVKIDPTAVSSVSIPPRPKKKSERVSWIPTVEDGPTRSSSRRQTMVNKEKTHARLKDSQEKRIRIIATMKEAEKRKAHLKPKEMTQEDHLEEAARIERLNSKSLNRWEQAERRKADERRARIEALQNRRLEGPVMSYWSGLATWANGRLTHVGKAEIKAKPEKEPTKKKKSEKDEKTPVPGAAAGVAPAPAASTEAGVSQGTPGPTPLNPNVALPASSIPTEGANPHTTSSTDPTTTTSTDPATINSTGPATTTSTDPATTSNQNPPPEASTAAAPAAPDSNEPAQPEKPSEPEQPNGTEAEKSGEAPEKAEQAATAPERRSSQGHPLPTVEIHTRRESVPTESNDAAKEKPSEAADSMDIDTEPSAPKAQAAQPTIDSPATAADKPAEATSEQSTQAKPTPNISDPSGTATHSDTSAPPPLVPDTPQAPHPLSAQTPQATQTTEPTPPAPAENNGTAGAGPGPETNPPSGVGEASMQPEVPQPPPVIEYTGRNLTILENFDDRTAHSKKYSMYFNARKPPRLTKISSSLCVITSLPSRYRDPETSLPYANSYAYGQIRRIMSEGYIWSSMLGCFVGPAETAARGVPNRFLGKEENEESKAASEKPAAESMEVDS